jgi:hypothetical protein
MKTRDAWAVGTKLAAVLIAREAIRPLGLLIGQTHSPSTYVVQNILEIILYLAAAWVLWFKAEGLARWPDGEPSGPSTSSVDPLNVRRAASVGLALVGIWLIAHGIVNAVGNIGAYVTANDLAGRFAPANPLRRQSEWQIIAAIVEALVGIVVFALRSQLAATIAPEA